MSPYTPAAESMRSGNLLGRFDLTGRIAIVTGASSGLGVAIAHGLAQAGASVAICARREEALTATLASLRSRGHHAIAVRTDVTDPEDCETLVAQTIAQFGRVDVLVNNAGVATAVPATREQPRQFRSVVDVNLCGAYWMAQACGRLMSPGSSIVNISSALALTTMGLPQAAYASSKAGLLGLTRDLAQQWTARKGIRVNAIAPGFFESEMLDQYPAGYLNATIERRVIAGRAGRPEELAATVVFLASDAAAYITGAVVPVDGGLLLT